MAVIAQDRNVAGHPAEGITEAPKFPWMVILGLCVGMMIVFGAMRWYQNEFSFTVGLDYFDPEFQKYWMTLFYIQITVIGLAGAILIPYTWFTRDKELNITPQEELRRYYMILAVLAVGGLALYFALNIFTEADAAWHQVTVRDTDFTPTHIFLFYAVFPMIFVGVMFAFVWIQTRMPDFKDRISIPLMVIGGAPLMLGPTIGLNEWGHTFFYAEELFGAPIHWGFVVFGWSFFAIGGLLIQFFRRIAKLTDIIGESEQASSPA